MAVMRSLIVGAARLGIRLGFLAALVASGLASRAYAQKSEDNKTPMQIYEETRKKEAEAVDKQYKSTVQKTNREAVESRTDPWQNMRGTDEPKAKR